MAVGVLTNQTLDPINGFYSATYTAAGSVSASGVYIGFVPRVIRMTQIGGTPGATSRVSFHESMTAAYVVLEGANGALTIGTSNGFTLTTGSEASPVAIATGSPNSAGPGFVIGTSAQTASLIYKLEAYR